MEYTVDQAKNVFDLIRLVSPYAYPLLISLIFPIIWILLKKLMGLGNKTNEQGVIQGNLFKRIMAHTRRVFSLTGDNADKVVFYGSIFLFFLGGIILKIGEYNEEVIRQRTLGLKHFYEESGYLFIDTSALFKQNFTQDEINDITYKYPDEFLKSGPRIVCVDTTIKRKVYLINHILLEIFIREKLKNAKSIVVDDLFQDDAIFDSTMHTYRETKNVKNFFSKDIVYTFLTLPSIRDKYNLDVINDRTVIIKQ